MLRHKQPRLGHASPEPGMNFHRGATHKLKKAAEVIYMVEATVPNESNQERAIRDAADKIINNTLSKHGITRDQLPPGAVEDAHRAAKEMIDAKANDPYAQMYEQQKQENEALRTQLAALRDNRSVSTEAKSYKHPVSEERARRLAGDGQWYMYTTAQKLQAIGVPDATEDQCRKLFGARANGPAALDFSKANPKRYAALREAAKVYGVYGG